MDYLEGMLLHEWWTDSDYASRKHTGTWYFYSFLIFLATAYAAWKINTSGDLFIVDSSNIYLAITIVLFILTPLIGKYYFSFPVVFRIIALAILGVKYLSFFMLLIAKFAELLIIPDSLTLASILDWGNATVGDFWTETTANMGVNGLFVGALVIGLICLAALLVLILLILYIPMLSLYMFNLCQYAWDYLIGKLLAKITKRHQDKLSPEKTKSVVKETTQDLKKVIQ